ncbi:lysophospholipase L1-like esterase [Frankia sp. EI5c]|uniref:SGNH/GDSL hydrolase family protein n=1 Tax=Frankia sp. EI5c TaxID=683316 RepID=UPI0007C20065|nr:lysophospholipase L1-like esterase [Frankia sp. EI5c]
MGNRSNGGVRLTAGRAAVAVLAGSFVIGVVGCSSDESSSPTPTSSNARTPTSSAAPALRDGDLYVALGSSIASGFGISEQSECGRSSRDYPQLVAAELGLRLVDVSCGAASVPHVVDTNQGENPPQIDAVTADTKLITVTVGGNDIAFNGTALGCGDPARLCTEPVDLEANLRALPGQLVSMVEKLQAKAPSARIVFVTYPREMPDTNCPAMSLEDSELAMLRSMGEKLEAAFVEAFATSDALLVDPYAVAGDHTACGPESARWTNGYTVPEGDGFAYHPTAVGHRAMADLIKEALTDRRS